MWWNKLGIKRGSKRFTSAGRSSLLCILVTRTWASSVLLCCPSNHRLSNGVTKPQTQVKPWAKTIFPPFKWFLSGVCHHSDKTLRATPSFRSQSYATVPLPRASCSMLHILSTGQSLMLYVRVSPHNLNPSDSALSNGWMIMKHLFLLFSWAVTCYEPSLLECLNDQQALWEQQFEARRYVHKTVTCYEVDCHLK